MSISDSQSNHQPEQEKEDTRLLNPETRIEDTLNFIREEYHHLNIASIEHLLQAKGILKNLNKEFERKKIPLKKIVLVATVFLQTLITGLDIHYYGFNMHRIYEWFILFLPCIIFSMYATLTLDGLTHLGKLAFNREDYRHLKQIKKSIKNHNKSAIDILHNEPYQFMCFQAIDSTIEQLTENLPEFAKKLMLEETREAIKQGILERRYSHTLGLIEDFSVIVDKLPYHYRQWKKDLSVQPEYLYENRYQKWKKENEQRRYPYNEIRQFNQKSDKHSIEKNHEIEEEHSAHWFQEFFKKIL